MSRIIKKTNFYIAHIFLLLIFTSCIRVTNNGEYERFVNNFKEITLPFSINDSIAFKDWPSEDFIDTVFIKKYDLISKFSHEEYPPIKLMDYQCSYIGRYSTKKCKVLIYRMFTTEAGRGNPVIILATLSSIGKKIDDVIVLWNNIEDPFYAQRVTLKIFNNRTLEIIALIKVYGYLDGSIVPKKITEKRLGYTIQKDGEIILTERIAKELYKDDDPNILDDFPQEEHD